MRSLLYGTLCGSQSIIKCTHGVAKMNGCAWLVEAQKRGFPGNAVFRKRLVDWTEFSEYSQCFHGICARTAVESA